MNNIYKLTQKENRSAVYFSYKNGVLLEFVIDHKESIVNWSEIRQHIPMDENYVLSQRLPEHIKIDILKPRNVSDKLAAFCMAFRQYRNSAYTTKKQERANVADVMMSDRLLETYFTSNEYPLNYAKSIADYVKHYNLIRDIAANGKPVKSKFPDVYDREYERTLEGETLSQYRQHLIKLGWRKNDAL
jgi:hypothetical protein